MSSAIARLKEHPKGFWFVFWGELAERASFYGMRTILALYLYERLAYSQSQGASILNFFIAACYVAPLLGGYLADRWLGRFKTILYFSIPYVAGHIILGGIETRTAMFIALAFLAMGSGSIKPNTSTLMGQLYEEQKKSFLLTEAFSYFYAAINIGAALSSLGLPLVRAKYGYVWASDVAGLFHVQLSGTPEDWGYMVALMIPAVLMVAAFIAFAAGRRHYPQDDVKRKPVKMPPKTPEQRAAEWKTLGKIAPIFALIAVFWFVYDQSASTWIYFAKDHLNLTILPGVTITPEQPQALNPVFIVALTPLFNWLWDFWKRKRGGVDLPDTRKMLIGFGIVIATMGTMAFAGYLSASGPVSAWWEIGAVFVITLAELCVSVVGLEFAYTQALPGTKSTVTAAFLFTVFIGDFFGGFFDQLYDKLSPGNYFAIQTGIMVVAAIAFVLVARKFEAHAEAEEAPAVAA